MLKAHATGEFSKGRRHCGYVSGRWYSDTHNAATASGVVATAGRMWAHTFTVEDSPLPIDKLAIRVITGGTGSAVKLAIYNNNPATGQPNELIAQASTESATTAATTDVEMTLNSPVTLLPGIYWLAQVHNWSTTAPIVVTYSTVVPSNSRLGTASAATAITQTGGFLYADITYATAFPATFGTPTYVSGVVGNPAIIVVKAQ